jgi:phage-related protein
LDKIQRGLSPEDWKPMKTVGPGVQEIRVKDDGEQFRVFYVATIGTKVYVLHAFHKKTEQTEQHDIDLAKGRYKRLIEELKKNGSKK